MKPFENPRVRNGVLAGVVCLALFLFFYFRTSPSDSSIPAAGAAAKAGVSPATKALPAATTNQPTHTAAATNAPVSTNATKVVVSRPSTNAVPAKPAPTHAAPSAAGVRTPGTTPPGKTPAAPASTATMATTAKAAGTSEKGSSNPEEIQLSFKNANIDLIAKWLAETTGKSVLKHPEVRCQLTIISPKKLPRRQAIQLVYRALALQGYTTIESNTSIILVPEGKEPKLSPSLVESPTSQLPEGRQRMIKVFNLQHVNAQDLRQKLQGVLSSKGNIEADAHANKLIVADYTDNIRLVGELIQELDVVSVSDSAIQIFDLKHSEAEDLASLLNLVMNAKAGTPSTSSSHTRHASMGPPNLPSGVVISSPRPSFHPSSPPAASTAGESVKIWPDPVSNRLIVAAPKAKMEEVQRLINVLDTEKPKDVAVRVVPLKHVDASSLARDIGPLYEKMSGHSVKDMIEVAANDRSNSLIVFSSEANYKSIADLVAQFDTEEAQEKVMKAFPLKNADAEDVAQQLQDLTQEQSSSRYVYYFSPDSQQQSKMHVVADRRRNTVIVQAPPASMDSIAKMIAVLDQPVSDNALAPKIFRLKYVSAVDIEDVLNELFVKKQQQRSYFDYFYDYESGGNQSASGDVGRLYGKVRITSEPYSNSIIVTSNSQENLDVVAQVLKQLDVPSEEGQNSLRFTLNFAKAVEVAKNINILFAKGGSPPLRNPNQQQNQTAQNQANQQPTGLPASSNFELEAETKEEAYYPWLGGQPENQGASRNGQTRVRPVSDLVGRVRVVPDRRTNSLLITCSVHYLTQILKLISELDAPTAQVLIEAKIIEVSSDFRDRLGVRWSPDGSKSFDSDDQDNGIIAGTTTTYSKTFAGRALANALDTGVLSSQVNVDFLIQFLRKNAEATVLAEPQINIRDNEMGRLFVGAKVPFISRTSFNPQGSRNDSFQYLDVGIILEVTPHINNSQDVALRVRAESSSIRNGQTLFGGAILDTRNFRTDLLVHSGETLVLGGIIQKQQQSTVRKVPLFGSIPGLGWLFKKKDTVNRNVELMVFLRPRVTRTPEEARQLLKEIRRSAPQIDQSLRESDPPSQTGKSNTK